MWEINQRDIFNTFQSIKCSAFLRFRCVYVCIVLNKLAQVNSIAPMQSSTHNESNVLTEQNDE